MFVVFSSNQEVIVTTLEQEEATVKNFFTFGSRNLDDYDRDEVSGMAVHIVPEVIMSIGEG